MVNFIIPYHFLHSLCKCMGSVSPHWKYAVVGYAKSTQFFYCNLKESFVLSHSEWATITRKSLRLQRWLRRQGTIFCGDCHSIILLFTTVSQWCLSQQREPWRPCHELEVSKVKGHNVQEASLVKGHNEQEMSLLKVKYWNILKYINAHLEYDSFFCSVTLFFKHMNFVCSVNKNVNNACTAHG